MLVKVYDCWLLLGQLNLLQSKPRSVIARSAALLCDRNRRYDMVEPLLDGIVLGLIVITLAGLFFAAYQQYKRGKQLGL
jgi:cytochrome b6-f complex subunit 5